tara:strand:- start:224 stop:553 length:330 start_codon:yes stop_codon:yes gene_type:complete
MNRLKRLLTLSKKARELEDRLHAFHKDRGHTLVEGAVTSTTKVGQKLDLVEVIRIGERDFKVDPPRQMEISKDDGVIAYYDPKGSYPKPLKGLINYTREKAYNLTRGPS